MTDVTRNLDLIRDHNNEGYLVCLDQAKGFDKVNHTYLFEVLKKIGINGKFLKGVQEIYIQEYHQPDTSKQSEN